MNRLFTYLALIIFFAGFYGKSEGNDELPEERFSPVLLRPYDSFLLDAAANSITDPTHSLEPFYNQLARLTSARLDDGTRTVPIFHLGDSHIQAGFLTGAVMRLFHRDFGNAGRGLISPYKMARTNEPSDYVIRSNATWEGARLIQSRRTLPVGLGGVAIRNREPNISLTVQALEKNSTENYAFNRIHILHNPGAPRLEIHDDQLGPYASYVENDYPFLTTYALSESVSELTLAGHTTRENRDSSIYYSFVLENGHNGVLYHAAGINGAQFLHWTRESGWYDQCEVLRPTLVILSMGSNEAMLGNSFGSARFEAQIDEIVRGLKQRNPQTTFLFTTPPQTFIRRRVSGRYVYDPNPLTERVSEVIRNYAGSHGYACWDLYAISGGDGSCDLWQENELLRPDHMHFTAEGYELLANYLYRAIIKGYNRYVTNPVGESAPHPEV